MSFLSSICEQVSNNYICSVYKRSHCPLPTAIPTMKTGSGTTAIFHLTVPSSLWHIFSIFSLFTHHIQLSHFLQHCLPLSSHAITYKPIPTHPRPVQLSQHHFYCNPVTTHPPHKHGVALRVVLFGLDFQPKLKIDVISLLTNKMPLRWFLDAMLNFYPLFGLFQPPSGTPPPHALVLQFHPLLPSGFGVMPPYHSNPHFCGQ